MDMWDWEKPVSVTVVTNYISYVWELLWGLFCCVTHNWVLMVGRKTDLRHVVIGRGLGSLNTNCCYLSQCWLSVSTRGQHRIWVWLSEPCELHLNSSTSFSNRFTCWNRAVFSFDRQSWSLEVLLRYQIWCYVLTVSVHLSVWAT